jgi:hypothetical protein
MVKMVKMVKILANMMATALKMVWW